MENSSGSWKTAVGVVVVIVLIGVGTWYFSRSNSAPQTAQVPVTPTQSAPQVQAPVVPAAVSDIQSRDTTNASLLQDAAAIDSQIALFSGDSSQVDKSLSDTPVTQAK